MKADSYKYAYPRTLLADVLALLVQRRGVSVAALEKLSGVNRGTIHGILAAQRSCDGELRRAVLAPLLDDNSRAAALSAMFDGNATAQLAIPDLFMKFEPSLMPRRQAAMQRGVDIGALAEKYALEEICRDAVAMQQSNKWPVACRWAALLAAAAHYKCDVAAELRAHLLRARVLLSSSQFAEARNAVAQVLNHPCLQDVPDETDPDFNTVVLRTHGQLYLGWLDYEIGSYDRAIRSLDTAIGGVKGLFGADCKAGGRSDGLPATMLRLLRQYGGQRHQFHYCSPLELLDLALHTRAKVLAERAMYLQEYTNEREMLSAARALVESMAVTGFIGNRGMLGHGLLWLARLMAVWMASISADTPGEAALLSPEIAEILHATDGPTAVLLPRALTFGEGTPRALLSMAARECFNHFQSSSMNRGYYQRAKGAVLALEGDYSSARSSFEDAYDLLAQYAPDARGVGPLFYERYLLQLYCRSSTGSVDHLDWLMAAAVVHPTGFVANAIHRERQLSIRVGRSSAINAATNRVLAFQKPFGALQGLGAALWGDAADRRMRDNINRAICGEKAGAFRER